LDDGRGGGRLAWDSSARHAGNQWQEEAQQLLQLPPSRGDIGAVYEILSSALPSDNLLV
jgi:hypothetical protein